MDTGNLLHDLIFFYEGFKTEVDCNDAFLKYGGFHQDRKQLRGSFILMKTLEVITQDEILFTLDGQNSMVRRKGNSA